MKVLRKRWAVVVVRAIDGKGRAKSNPPPQEYPCGGGMKLSLSLGLSAAKSQELMKTLDGLSKDLLELNCGLFLVSAIDSDGHIPATTNT